MPLERLVTAVSAPAHAVGPTGRARCAEAREDAGGAAEGEALVADLRRGGDGDVVDAVWQELRVAAQWLAEDRDRRSSARVSAYMPLPALPKGADGVDED